MVQVSVYEARNQLSRLVKQAADGEDVVIANRGVPVARLTAYDAPTDEEPRDLVAWLRSHPLPARLRRDAETLDAAIDAEREGWE